MFPLFILITNSQIFKCLELQKPSQYSNKSIINGLDKLLQKFSVQCLHLFNICSLIKIHCSVASIFNSLLELFSWRITASLLLIFRMHGNLLLFSEKHFPQSNIFSFLLDDPISTLLWFSLSLPRHSFFFDFSNSSSFYSLYFGHTDSCFVSSMP